MQVPGQLFVGTLSPQDKAFLKPLITNARESGYERFIEPCAGALAMSCLAVECGYKVAEISASDVSLFSGVLGRACMGSPISDMGIKAAGFSEGELSRPEMVLYAQIYLKTFLRAGQDYYMQLLNDLRYRKNEHLERLKGQIDGIAAKLSGITYRDFCMWKHLRETLDDPKALIVICPPTYKAGYEKFFDTGGKITWNEPDFGVFDPETGLDELHELAKGAKALLICYEEREAGQSFGREIYGRHAGRPGVNMYLTSNRPDEAARLAGGRKITCDKKDKLEPLKAPILPRSHQVTEASEVVVAPIKPENCGYYRKLWTHNFVGSGSSGGFGMFIDGFMAGVFGYEKGLSLAIHAQSDMILSFGISAPSDQRLNRLLYMLALCASSVCLATNDYERERVKGLQTAIITKYPESKEMRGIMKMVSKDPDKLLGFKLVYRADLINKSAKEVLAEWCVKERKWQDRRSNTNS